MTCGRLYTSHDQLFLPFSDGNNMATSKKDNWDYGKDEDLIDLYKANRCLYDTGSVEYSNRDLKENIKLQQPAQ